MALIQVDSQDLPLFDLPLYLQELFGISLKDSSRASLLVLIAIFIQEVMHMAVMYVQCMFSCRLMKVLIYESLVRYLLGQLHSQEDGDQ